MRGSYEGYISVSGRFGYILRFGVLCGSGLWFRLTASIYSLSCWSFLAVIWDLGGCKKDSMGHVLVRDVVWGSGFSSFVSVRAFPRDLLWDS